MQKQFKVKVEMANGEQTSLKFNAEDILDANRKVTKFTEENNHLFTMWWNLEEVINDLQ